MRGAENSWSRTVEVVAAEECPGGSARVVHGSDGTMRRRKGSRWVRDGGAVREVEMQRGCREGNGRNGEECWSAGGATVLGNGRGSGGWSGVQERFGGCEDGTVWVWGVCEVLGFRQQAGGYESGCVVSGRRTVRVLEKCWGVR